MVMNEIVRLRALYHEKLCCKILAEREGSVNIADVDNESSKAISSELSRLIGGARCKPMPKNPGKLFSEVTRKYVEQSFLLLQKLRPGDWGFMVERSISDFDQYRHLKALNELAKENRNIGILLGEIYLVKPDIVVFRKPVLDEQLKSEGDNGNYDDIAKYTPLRQKIRIILYFMQ
nr:NgoMIV family type II restriction endonuclease [Methanocella conradii]